MSDCTHGTADDYSRMINIKCDIGGRVRVWKCSYCGEEGPWSDGYEYYGTIECRSCNMAGIDEVRCKNCRRN